MQEVGFDLHTKKPLVFVDKRYFRPMDVHCLLGDARKAHEQLKWQPIISFHALVQEMVEADRRAIAGKRDSRIDSIACDWHIKNGVEYERELS